MFDEVIVAEAPEVEIRDVSFTIPRRGDKAKLLEVSEKNARQNRIDDLRHLERHNPEERTSRLLERIKSDFRLSELPRHIECFDNSNIQGTNPVASCVVFRDGAYGLSLCEENFPLSSLIIFPLLSSSK